MYTMLGGGASGCAAASGTPPTLLADNAKTKTMTRRAHFMQESPPQSMISCCTGLTTTLRQRPNAAAQPRLEAGARHERTLEGVGCSRLLGPVLAPGSLENGFLTPFLFYAMLPLATLALPRRSRRARRRREPRYCEPSLRARSITFLATARPSAAPATVSLR